MMHFTGISRAFHRLIFHGVFIETNTNRAARTLESRTSSDAGMHAGLRLTRAVLLGLIIACYRIKCFPGLNLVIGTIEIRARLYVTCSELKLEVNYIWDLIVYRKSGFHREKRISRFSRVNCRFHRIGPKTADFTGPWKRKGRAIFFY